MTEPVTVFLSESLRSFLEHPENFLGRSEFRVVSALGGNVALEAIRELKPPLAVIDCEQGEGVKVAERIKGDGNLTNTQVLVTMKDSDTERMARAKTAGADVMVGSFTPRELLSRILELLSVPANQRRHVRALFGVSFDGKTVTGTFLGNTVNISESGMLVEADQELSLGERLEVRFFLPGDQRPVDVKCKVVRKAPEVEGQMRAFGVTFQSVSDEDMARIRSYVAAQAGAS